MHRYPLHRFTNHFALLLLAGVCYLLFFYGLGSIGLLGPDEPRYAAVAREMYVSGDYVTPRLLGVPWFEKPALMYWGAALGYAVFGVNEFGARFPSALGAALCVLFIYYGCTKLWGRATGIWAALITASSTGIFAFSRAASMDMPLTACLTLALMCFLLGRHEEGSRARWWFYAFYGCLGLALLAKGPVGLVLPAASIGAYMLYLRRFNEWKQWHPEGLLITFAVAVPWYAAVIWANGYEFIQVFLINQNFQRFASTIHGHERPFYFYIPDFLMLTFPWTFLLIPAIKRKLEPADWLLVSWAAIPIIFFSFSGSKLPGYILPSVPPFAILCARQIPGLSSRAFKIAVLAEAGVMLLVGIVLGFFGDFLNIDPHVNPTLIAAVAFTVAALVLAAGVLLKPAFMAGLNLIVVGFVVAAAVTFVFPRFDVSDTMRPWNDALEGLVPPEQTVFLYKPARWVEYGMQYYRHSNSRGIFSPEELIKLTSGAHRIFVITEDRQFGELSRIGEVEMEIVQTIGNQTALWAWSAP